MREDAVPKEVKRWRLGEVGYAVFAANKFWKGCSSAKDLVRRAPIAELLPGGQFVERWHEWLAKEGLNPKVFARVVSFTELARIVQVGHAAAVLPEMAAVDFDPKKFQHEPITAQKNRTLALIANARSLDRAGIAPGVAGNLESLLKLV